MHRPVHVGLKTVRYVSFILLGLLLTTAILLGGYYFYNRDNFHILVKGKYYRSAQLDGAQLTRVIRRYHLKSIISLRAPNPSKLWYQQEIKISKNYGVKHYNLWMAAYSLPSPYGLSQLVKLLRSVPKPVLVHCQGGADRTGLASAIVMLLRNQSIQQAKKQISIRYFVISQKSVGRLVLPYYKYWLQQQGLKSDRQNFLRWVHQVKFA